MLHAMLADLGEQRRLSRLTDELAERVRALGGELGALADQFVGGFYEHLDSFEQTREILDAQPGRRERLHASQARYFKELLGGTYDAAYAERRRRVGHVHFTLGIEPHLYLGGYAKLLGELVAAVVERDALGVEALLSVAGFDMGLTLSAYDSARLVDTLDQLGVEQLDIARGFVSMETGDDDGDDGGEPPREAREAYFGLGPTDYDTLSARGEAAMLAIDDVIADFYNHIDTFESLARLFRSDASRERLSEAQRLHWRRFFGAPRDRAYFARQRALGRVHHQMGLSLSAYLSALMLMVARMANSAICHGAASPRDVASALVRAALLDASVTAQAYSDARARSIENIHDVEKVVSALPTGVLIASDALEVRSANRAALALVSVSRAMLLGNQLSAVLPYGRVVAAHATRLLRGDLAEPELVVEDTTSDGAPRTLRLTLARIEGGVLITLDDISKVRALQESASAMKRRQTALFEDVDAVVWEVPLDPPAPAFISGRVQLMTGFNAERWTEPTFWRTRLSPEQLERIAGHVQTLREPGSQARFECEILTASGARLSVRTSAHHVVERRQRLLRGVSVDVTATRDAERRNVAMQEMSTASIVAAGAAHDLSNVLQQIQAHVDLCDDDATPDEVRAELAGIRESIARGARLQRDLLDLTRLRPGAEPHAVDLGSAVGSALERFGASVSLRCRKRPVIAARPTWVERLVTNLVRNALEASDFQRSALVVLDSTPLRSPLETVQGTLEPGRYATIRVVDRGGGIDERVAARIFEPFVTTKPPGRGVGAGLAIASRIISRLHGGARVLRRHEGTIIEVFLPLATSE